MRYVDLRRNQNFSSRFPSINSECKHIKGRSHFLPAPSAEHHPAGYALRVRQQGGGYPTIMEKQKRPRESTDLDEYVVIVPKNITWLQVEAKLQLITIWFFLPKKNRIAGREWLRPLSIFGGKHRKWAISLKTTGKFIKRCVFKQFLSNFSEHTFLSNSLKP